MRERRAGHAAALAMLATLASVGCAGPAGLREHDAMLAELRDVDRRPQNLSRDALEEGVDRPADVRDLDRGAQTGSRGDRDGDRAAGADLAAVLGARLERAALIEAVLVRNPDLAAARATWRAALAGYAGAVAAADPMLSYELAPFSVAGDARYGQRVELRQKLRLRGTRELAGAAALADAEAARADHGTLRLALAEAAVGAFDDLYVAARAIEVNAHHRAMVEQIVASARAQYSVGRADQQDVLEAEAELIALARERLGLDTQQRAATARINRLLRRPPGAPLPPPPDRLDTLPAAPGTAAGAARPGGAQDLAAAADARVRARRAELASAERAAYPDVELMAAYDSMFDDWQHRFTVGIAVELPIAREGRRGAIARARAAVAAATAELASVRDVVAEDRDRAGREVDEAAAALALYEQRAVPNARARVEATRAGFAAGQTALAAVMMAERALRETELGVERARADLDRRTAAMDRLSGRIAGGPRGAR